MRKVVTKLGGAIAGATLFLSSATAALAQWDYEYSTTSSSSDEAAAGLFGAFWLVWCCIMLLSLGLLAFRIWMLVHVIKNAPEDKKTMWILLVLFVPLADWVYFFTKKKEWTAAAPKKSTES